VGVVAIFALGSLFGAFLAALVLTFQSPLPQPENLAATGKAAAVSNSGASPVSKAATNTPPVSKAAAYQIIRKSLRSRADRNRLSISIYSDAKTIETRAQTALKAALDQVKETGVHVASVVHLVAPDRELDATGYYLAKAVYSPDRGGVSGRANLRYGTWEASASDAPVDSLSLKIIQLWNKHVGDFLAKDPGDGPSVDEGALLAFVAGKMGMSEADVTSNRARLIRMALNLSDYPK